MHQLLEDTYFRVEVISQTPNPQQVMYAAMHQDYDEGFVADERESWPSEERCGKILVDSLLKGGRGHYGPLEHPQIVFNVGWFSHSTFHNGDGLANFPFEDFGIVIGRTPITFGFGVQSDIFLMAIVERGQLNRF